MDTREKRPMGKWNRTFVTAVLLTLVTAVAGFAGTDRRGPRRAPPDPAEKAERLTERLGLSDAQQQEVLAILEAQETKQEAVRERYSEQREAVRTEMDALRQETDALVMQVLTDEQAETFQETHDRRPPKRGGEIDRGRRTPTD